MRIKLFIVSMAALAICASGHAKVRAKQEKEAEMQADQSRIEALSAQIQAARKQVRREAAYVHDYNSRTWTDPNAPVLYQKQSAVVAVDEAEEQLQKLRAAFAQKYGKSPE